MLNNAVLAVQNVIKNVTAGRGDWSLGADLLRVPQILAFAGKLCVAAAGAN